MSRVVNPNSTGKARNQLMRTAAELLRHLSQKRAVDDEAKDMVAMLAFCLRGIEEGIEKSAQVWEKRDYWIKAERLRQRWSWAGEAATALERIVHEEDWEALPQVMATLLPHFSEIKILRFTRDPSTWRGAYRRLRERLSGSAL